MSDNHKFIVYIPVESECTECKRSNVRHYANHMCAVCNARVRRHEKKKGRPA